MMGFVERRAQVDRRVARAALVVRVMVGWVFLSEGVQKFLYPAAQGVGRFAKLGIPWPPVTGPFVGVVEIGCGALLLVGLGTGLAAWPLLIDIGVAIATTKVPMLMKQGFWATTHEGRTDFCMVLGLVAVMLMGGGAYSLDALVRRRGLDGI